MTKPIVFDDYKDQIDYNMDMQALKELHQEKKEMLAYIKELEAEIKNLKQELRSMSYGRD